MTTIIDNLAARAAADAIAGLLDGGALRIYDGTRPAGPETAITDQTLLAEVALQSPAFAAAVDADPGGEASLAGVPLSDLAANASGEASWFRLVDSGGVARVDGDCGTAVPAELILVTTTLVVNQEFKVLSLTLTMPEQ